MKPSSHRHVFWSFAGFALLGLAGWQSVALAGRKAAGDSAPPPPARTRSGERPLLRRETAAGDPVAHYLARAKRGMTEREVRWMIEDFEAAGLDRTVEQLVDFSEAKTLPKKVAEWYLAALGEGLNLTSDQKDEAEKKLKSAIEEDLRRIALLEEWLASNEPDIGDRPLDESDLQRAQALLAWWQFRLFYESKFAPWNLAQLTENQSSLTLRFWLMEDWKQLSAIDPFRSPDKLEPNDWLYSAAKGLDSDPFSDSPQSTLRRMPGLPAMQDPLSGNLTEFPNYTELPTLLSEDGQRLEAYLPCGNVLPLTPDQMRLWERSYDWAAQALLCHPAQLRLALLQQPHLAKILREELDLEPSQRGLQLPPKSAAPISSE